MVHAAIRGEGVALAPHSLFRRELESGQLARPFAIEANLDAYRLTRFKSKPQTVIMLASRTWLLGCFREETLA
ncbi:MAG: hypothetical protein ACYDD1_04315 [Caulobacteraceae bacterium]